MSCQLFAYCIGLQSVQKFLPENLLGTARSQDIYRWAAIHWKKETDAKNFDLKNMHVDEKQF